MKHFTSKSKYVLKALASFHGFTCLSPMIYKYQSHAHKAYSNTHAYNYVSLGLSCSSDKKKYCCKADVGNGNV